MPIEFTSDESKKVHRDEERYLYLRYIFIAVIGVSGFLGFSFADLRFLVPIVASVALLGYVEYKRSNLKRQETSEALPSVQRSERLPDAEIRTPQIPSQTVAPAKKEPSRPEDVLMIVVPLCIACAIISIASYQSFLNQLNLSNTTGARLDLSFLVLFAIALFGLLAYVGMLLWKMSRAKAEKAKQSVPSVKEI